MPRIVAFLAIFLVLFPLPAAAGIVTGPEIQLTTPVVEPPFFSQIEARLATDGDGFLAVWTEESAATGAIHAARVEAGGTRVDATPLIIAATPNLEHSPDVGWGASHYLVVWTDRDGIGGRFVQTDGTMSETFRVSEPRQPTTVFLAPRVIFNGRVFLVAWQAHSEAMVIGGAIVDAEGRVLKTGDLAAPESVAAHFRLASAKGTFYVVTWAHAKPENPIGLTSVSEDGTVTARQTIGHGGEEIWSLASASRNAADAVFAWTTLSHSSVRSVHSVRIGADGPEEVESFEIGTDRLDAVVADRFGYLIIHGSSSTRFARRLGTAESFDVPTLPAYYASVDAGATGAAGTILITESNSDLFVHPIDEASFTPLATAARHQSSPEIAAARDLRLAVWWEWNSTAQKRVVAAARINRTGIVLDPIAIEIAQVGTDQPHVRVASDGRNWLVVWNDNGTVKAARLSASGQLLDRTPVEIAKFIVYSNDTEVVWDGSTYVIVYVIGAPTRFGSQMTIMAARVSADGDMQTPHLPLSPTGSYFAPSIAVSPSGSLVVWTDTKFGAIDGALLSRASSVTPLAFPDVSGAFFSTAAAWNGENFLVASPLTSDEIRWFLVSDTGQVTSPPTPAWVPWKRPALTFFAAIEVQAAGDGFLLTFLNEGVIYAAAIDRAGTIEHARVVVARPAPRETSFGMSGTTIVYARQTDPLRDRLSRVFMRELQIVPDPPRRRAVR